jgi:two-component system CheB/CheR fusion protein
MGNDGEKGVKAIKEKLGLVVAQSPETAQYRAMPEAAIKTYAVDFVLNPADIPEAIENYLDQSNLKDPVANRMDEEYHHTIMQKILLMLRNHTGHDFTLYKKNTINRRIERRIVFHKLTNYEDYFSFISENPTEMETLFKELLIGVTKFFRDTEAYDSLTSLLYEKLQQKRKEDTIRIWVAGCSTGEESYSVAILILEYLAQNPIMAMQKVQIFATDLDDDAIDYARLGFYPNRIVDEVSPERLTRFFDEKNNGYMVKKELREMIVFAKHNLIKDAPFTRLDLLCCRNVIIYFSATLQKKLLPVFHYSLNNKGLMFLGPAETIGVYNEAFKIVDPKWKIFERDGAISSIAKMIDFPFNIATPNLKTLKELPVKIQTKISMANSFHKILIDKYTPTSLLVNEKGDILYVNGNVNKYMQINSGEALMNVHKIIRQELCYALSNAIHQAWLHKKTFECTDIKVLYREKPHLISFTVDYLSEGQLQNLLVVTFRDSGEVKKSRKSTGKIPSNFDVQAVTDLEKELAFTKQQLHSTIEQMESSLEELKSTNEELQSTNEELQSTNEEALTTKEEMQSLNEELMTINLQYQNKAEELTRLNNDMKNLLDNTEIGTIFLDNNLNILRFTPQVTKLFNVIPQDVGRSITHIVSNFDYPAIENAIVEVIDKLTGKELEVKTKKNEWYNLRIMPYRTMDNFISGAVLTFTKITPFKSLENRLSTLSSYVQTVVDTLKHAAVILDKDQKVLVVNRPFLKLFHLREEEIKDQFLHVIILNRWKTNKLFNLLKESKTESSYYLEHDFPEIGLLKLMVKVNYVTEIDHSEHTAIIVTFQQGDASLNHEKQ